jgi:NADH-quinone oxidoreductase subunit M
MDWPLLSIITFLPLVGVLAILLIRSDDAARTISLITTTAVFALTLYLWWAFDGSVLGSPTAWASMASRCCLWC